MYCPKQLCTKDSVKGMCDYDLKYVIFFVTLEKVMKLRIKFTGSYVTYSTPAIGNLTNFSEKKTEHPSDIAKTSEALLLCGW